MDNNRTRAYSAGARMARDRMSRESPLDAAALEAVTAADIVVVPGQYDHVDTVLDALAMPYTRLAAAHLAEANLRPEQLLIVNCPGNVGPQAIKRIRDFVERGGSLFTTDWALQNVIEPAFPGVLEYNKKATRDDVVRIEVRSADNPFLRGVMDGADDPQWWLEGSSYPIRVLAPERVEVLLASRELAERYGESPVAVLFRHGAGEVFHMISHYYLQRTELRSARHASTAAAYASEKGVAVGEDMADMSLGDLESAQTSARMLANVVAAKKRSVRP